jgi:signal transduction histidine kinase
MNSLTGTSVGSLAATAVVDQSARALSVPVRWQGTNLAAMVVAFKETGRPTAAEVELLEEVAGQVALGMERLRLQERVLEQQNEIAVSSERNRIARDMHDGIVQYVYGLGLNLEHARDLLQSDPAAVDESLATAVRQVNHVLSEMRTFIYQLRPTSMQEKEIGAWIIDLCRQFEQATGVTVDAVVGRSTGHELSPDISIALLRIVQEALANIYQHSGAKTARLRLDFSELSVRLSVEDDGRGFDPKTRPAPGIAGGRGLANIEERAAGLGGRFSLSSHPGRGTRLEVDVPYLAGSTVGGGSPR